MQLIYPKCLNDLKAIIKYANEKKLGIAVRTGGHQYCGYSSTSGTNIQLDLSDTFQSLDEDFQYFREANLIRLGVSFALTEITA